MDVFVSLADFFQYAINEQPYACLAVVFLIGAVVGSFLNVCIARMPLQKSVLWPGSRCGNCLQAIRWHDNIPLLSYWRLKGKCRSCGAAFSSRYFWIELLTGAAFAGLFWLEVIRNVRGVAMLPTMDGVVAMADGVVPAYQLMAIWFYHAILVSLLIVATMTDFDHMQIPIRLTILGTAIGVVGGALMPWPWPMDAGWFEQFGLGWQHFDYGGMGLREGDVFLLPAGAAWWPAWMPPPGWLPPGSWAMGLATSLAGAAAGSLLVRLIRVVFGYGLGKEAMGLGDADLMMMIGAFLGWQALIFTMIFGVLLGLLYAVTLIVRNRGNELPFGPFLAAGAVVTMLSSWWLSAIFQPAFFDLPWLVIITIVCSVLAFFLSLSLRMLRLVGQAA